MKILSIIQTVIILLVVAMAASCATGKEYTDRVFAKRTAVAKDSLKIRFLEEDSIMIDNSGEFIAVNKKKAEEDTLTIARDEPEIKKPSPVVSGNERTRRKRE